MTSSAIDHAWTNILQGSEDHVVLQALQRIFPDSGEYFEERNFTKLHKAILQNPYPGNLEVAIEENRTDIDTFDSQGLTPLIWAARRGDVVTVDYLLKARAKLNVSHRFSALHFAIRSKICLHQIALSSWC